MAKSPLPQLIRRSRLLVDEKRAELAAVLLEVEKSDTALRDHDMMGDAERNTLPDRPPEAVASFTAWSRHHARRRASLADLNASLHRTRDAALLALQDACADLKRLELADEARLAADKKAMAKRAEAKAEDAELIRRASS